MIEIEKGVKLLFFSSKNDLHVDQILRVLPDTISPNNLFCFNGITDFSVALRDTLLGQGIVLIVIRDGGELDQMIQLGQILHQHTILLVLEDNDTDLTDKSLKLYPRYTSFLKEEYSDVKLVLEKMVKKIQKN